MQGGKSSAYGDLLLGSSYAKCKKTPLKQNRKMRLVVSNYQIKICTDFFPRSLFSLLLLNL